MVAVDNGLRSHFFKKAESQSGKVGPLRGAKGENKAT